MSDFHPDDRDIVRRTYIQKEPCQPKNHVFPQRLIAPKKRHFCVKWFETWGSWLEYSMEKDSAYCFICYLFKDENAFGGDAFVIDGFRSWNRLDILKAHVDIINARAKETTKAILEVLNGGVFAILADELADISDKEQMAICLRYVNKEEVCEHLLGIVHVGDTTSLTLKVAIESLLINRYLSFSQVRGQGYDGASNMQGLINGLRTLIEKECKQAYFVHCFAHQLQLTQVALSRKNPDCAWLFSDMLAPLLNFVGCSPKRKEFLREKQAQAVVDVLSLGELETGPGLNQERGLGSLDEIAKAAEAKAQSIIGWLMTFDFVFVAHLMVTMFAITNELNVALQKHDQDIVNAMAMVNVTKTNLQELRDEGWDSLMEKILSFTTKYEIKVLDMNATYVVPGRRMFRGKRLGVSNLHHFRVEVFISVIDLQLQDLEN
ncbi:zinc finger MYM-type protein 1-like [Chenopodium quinoa]|uniref:zinc finger MYM-type protein 1-like n=1 Tax=Chenopodium quinoa TaxID=63459 RepID=UPI000B782D4B|nr:zinc finger MYM-type protein 1-like [Chenopodium quinoa]